MPEPAAPTRPLLDRLGVRPGARVCLVGLDDPELVELLAGRGADVHRGPLAGADLVIFRAAGPADLARLPELRPLIKPAGALWVVRPKGGGPISERDVMEAGLATGLVDNKVVSFSESESAMRFVVRLRDR